ncbi:hypothetical protein LJC45_01760 [Alistipes sp. OttesenSCG-928-B03]|nr:hypothetical protein [Alistipes sp. OttesenSCG-928-B03]
MKRATIFAMAAMLTFGLASCGKDAVEDGATPDAAGAALSFSFDKPVGNYVTYADPIASDSEWAINTLDAYVFNAADGTYKGKLATADYTSSVSERTTTITMSKTWMAANLGSTLRFYFVANNAASTDGAHIADAWTGTEAEFKALATNALAASTGADATKRVNIATPLLFSGVSSDIAVTASKISETVNIKRRVARFDIVNEIPTRFVIDRVLISDAREKGYIMADAGTGKSPADFNKVSMESVDVSGMTPVSDTGIDTYNSVFYTYPTQLDVTRITIMATLDSGAEAAWEIDATTQIEANKRYKLICKQATTTEDGVIFQVIADDFEEGAVVDVTPKQEGAVTLGTIDYPNLYHNTFFYTNGNAAGVKVVVPVNSIYGTEPVFNFENNMGSTLNYTVTNTDGNPIDYTKSTAVTYGYGTVDTYTFDLPVTADAEKDKVFDIKVTFKAKADATKTTEIRFVRMTSVPAVAGILSYEEGGAGLNLDGLGKPLYFKWGSLIGTDASQPYTGAAFDAATDVLFKPATFSGTITDWASIPYGDPDTYLDAFPVLDEVAGLGDPCALLGAYKMPSGNHYNGTFFSDSVWGLNDNKTAMGRTFDGQFYPAAGYRNHLTGEVQYIGRCGFYWSSTPDRRGATNTNFRNDFIDENGFNGRSHGFTVRCVPAN